MRVNARSLSLAAASFNKYTPYQRMQIQRYKMRQMYQQSQSNASQLSSGVFGASLSLSQGISSSIAQAALQRVKDSVAAKQTQLNTTLSSATGVDVSA